MEGKGKGVGEEGIAGEGKGQHQEDQEGAERLGGREGKGKDWEQEKKG